MTPVTGTSSGADAECFRGLNTQHDPWRASPLAWRTCRDDNGLLGTLRYARSDESRRCDSIGAPGSGLARSALPRKRVRSVDPKWSSHQH
jgi:hypothetical protein